MPLLDLGSPGASFFLRATASLGLLLTVMGLNCFGPVFSLPVIDAARFGSLLLLQSFVCLGFVLFAFDINHLELSLFLQAISCLDVSFFAFSMAFLDSSIPVLDPAQLGVLVLLHALACPEPVPSTFGSSSLGLSPMALDLGSLGFLLMARSVPTLVRSFQHLLWQTWMCHFLCWILSFLKCLCRLTAFSAQILCPFYMVPHTWILSCFRLTLQC